MKDLFNDDIFEQATDSEIMESAVCSCIYKKINSKFETWKKFMSTDPSKISGFTKILKRKMLSSLAQHMNRN